MRGDTFWCLLILTFCKSHAPATFVAGALTEVDAPRIATPPTYYTARDAPECGLQRHHVPETLVKGEGEPPWLMMGRWSGRVRGARQGVSRELGAIRRTRGTGAIAQGRGIGAPNRHCDQGGILPRDTRVEKRRETGWRRAGTRRPRLREGRLPPGRRP